MPGLTYKYLVDCLEHCDCSYFMILFFVAPNQKTFLEDTIISNQNNLHSVIDVTFDNIKKVLLLQGIVNRSVKRSKNISLYIIFSTLDFNFIPAWQVVIKYDKYIFISRLLFGFFKVIISYFYANMLNLSIC